MNTTGHPYPGRPARRRIAIYGGSGYGTSELLRILWDHPGFEVSAVVSSTKAGQPVTAVHTHLAGLTDMRFCSANDLDPGEHDALVFALPHGHAAELLPLMLARRPELKVVDLSADFRLRQAADYPIYYGKPHPNPTALSGFVYGLSELFPQEIAAATRVANPGCFATTQILALAPFVRAGLAGTRVVTSGATGSSGSGAEPVSGTHHPERAESYRAYKPLTHQHVGEIRQTLAAVGRSPELYFVPHSAPMTRGIYLTAYLFPERPVTQAEAREVLVEAYRGRPFVRVLSAPPALGAVLRTNFCDLSVAVEGGCVVVLAALDNLVKGMSGQAVQNLNLMFGLEQTTGLLRPGFRP